MADRDPEAAVASDDSTLRCLPALVRGLLFSQLDLCDLVRLASCCRWLRAAVFDDHPHLWRTIRFDGLDAAARITDQMLAALLTRSHAREWHLPPKNVTTTMPMSGPNAVMPCYVSTARLE